MGSDNVQAFTPVVKQAITTRQNGKCAVCGLRVDAGHFHHRKPRRAGGGRDRRVGAASNGLLLHTSCHDRIEKNRQWAYERGYLLHAGEWPEEVPVKTWQGWMILEGDFEYRTEGKDGD